MGFSLPSFPQISSSIRVSFSIFNALMTSFTFWHVDSLIMTHQFMHDHWKLMLGQLMNNCSRVLEPFIILNMNIRVTVVETTCTQPAQEQIKTVLVMFVFVYHFLWNWPWTKSTSSQSSILLTKWIRFLSIGRPNQRKFKQLSEYKNLSDKHLKLKTFQNWNFG